MKMGVYEAAKRRLLWDINIRFNGLNIKNCKYADEENGVIVVYDVDIAIKHNLSEMPTKVFVGDVQILMGDRK